MSSRNPPQPRERLELLEGSTVSTHVSQASEPQLPSKWDIKDPAVLGSPFESLPERQLLYYDEHVNVYVLLYTTCSEETPLKKAVGNLTITLEAYAEPSRSLRDGDTRNPHSRIPNKDLIYRETLDECPAPLFIFRWDSSGEDHDVPGGLGAVWKFNAFIGRPPNRHQQSSITFIAVVEAKAPELSSSGNLIDEYLPSLSPAGINLLESFHGDPDLSQARPYLSATRVSRVIPRTDPVAKLHRRVESPLERTYWAVSPANFRIRYSTLQTPLQTTSVIATLELEVTHLAECDLSLDELSMWLEDGEISSLVHPERESLPQRCKFGERIMFMYRLTPDDSTRRYTRARVLEVILQFKALASLNCHAPITMKWRTTIDFVAEIQSSNAVGGFVPTPLAGLALTPLQRRSESSDELGILVTISGPYSVRLHVGFVWSIFILNRSTSSKELGLYVITDRSSSSKNDAKGLEHEEGGHQDVAAAILDDNKLLAQHQQAATKPLKLLCFSTDLRLR
ncbi:MAG: hypothetical protein M1823_001765 [Watsoniomyces obsoletus]|nr:MAG: hypothetical protein M1823_001765 [Watsoniomyces obsoletus]